MEFLVDSTSMLKGYTAQLSVLKFLSQSILILVDQLHGLSMFQSRANLYFEIFVFHVMSSFFFGFIPAAVGFSCFHA